jgi:ankyrin repeat protein
MRAKPDLYEAPANARLLSAVWQGDALLVSMRLGLGEVDVNGRDYQGRTPLHIAAMRGHKQIVEVLLARGADPALCDNDGWTPLHWAMSGGYAEVVKLLRDHSGH